MFDGYIRDNAAWRPRAPALVTPRRSVTYAQFDADIDRFGAGLARLGVGPGSGIVSVRVVDHYLHRVALCALSRLGVVSSPAADEAADLTLAYGPDEVERANALKLTREWSAETMAAPATPLPRIEPDPDRLVRVQLSSGTTAAPKRIGFTWSRLEIVTLTNIRVYGGRTGYWAPITGPDSLMGFSMAITAWAVGAAHVSGVLIEQLPEMMERDPSGVVVITPVQLRLLLAALPAGFALKPGWRLQVGGSALPAALAQEAELRITPDLWHGYGATESSRITAAPASTLADTPGAVGVVPASAIVEIRDEAGRPLPDGQTGELAVKSTRTSPGYLDDPQATADRFRDGWYLTGDLARRLPDGRIVIEGRIDDRMNLGGRKLMPVEVERVAEGEPGVADCAAFAVPGAAGLDACWLAVVASDGLNRDALAARLHAAGIPDVRFAWIDEIPRNEMGKVERVTLRRATLEALGEASS